VSAARYDISSYVFNSSTHYFLDTNVWFLVFGPSAPGDPRALLYSDGVKRLRSSGATILIDAIVMSEFANAWSRFEFRRVGAASFKAFRGSAPFKLIAQDIVISLRSILSVANPTGTSFANIHLAALLATFEQGGSDLNDLLIVETCRSKSCVLLTDDGDMKWSDVPIVTGNQLLLKP
jgi:predicted nucleic acid-binding protein